MAERFDLWEPYVSWLVDAWRLVGDPEHLPSGRAPARGELSGIEAAHDLPEGQLTSLADLLWLCDGIPADGVLPWGAVPDPIDAETRSELTQRCIAGVATAAEWSRLGHALVSVQEPIPVIEAQGLADALVIDLPRGIKHCYRQHRVAATILAARPEMAEPLVAAIRGCVHNPEGPAFLEPIGLLVYVPSPAARDLALDLLERPRTPDERRYAVWLATQLVLQGDFDAAQRSRLSVIVMTYWRADGDSSAVDLAELVDVLPEGLRRLLLGADERGEGAGGQPVGDLVGSTADLLVSTLLGAITTSGGQHGAGDLPSDLLRMATCHTSSEIRHGAGQLLSGSPYRKELAGALIDILAVPGVDPLARRRVVTLLANLADESHRLRMLTLLDDPQAEVAAGVLAAFGHLELNVVSDQELRQRLPGQHVPFGRQCMYALGMTGSDVLASLAAAPRAPEWQRESARWWLAAGPAIRR